MKEMGAIDMLRQVMLGERKEKLPKNRAQERRSSQIEEQARSRQASEAEQPRVEQAELRPVTARPTRALSPVSVADVQEHTVAKDDDDEFNYISDDKDDVQP